MRRNMEGNLLIRPNMSLADPHLVLPKTCLTLQNLKMMKLVMTTTTILYQRGFLRGNDNTYLEKLLRKHFLQLLQALQVVFLLLVNPL